MTEKMVTAGNTFSSSGPMRRVVLLALVVVLVAGLVAAVIGRRAPEQAYTVAQVRAGLARQPAAWAGRTLLVRGVATESFWATGPTTGGGYFCDPGSIGGPPQSCPLAAPHGATVYLTLVDDSDQQANTPTLVLAVQPVAPNPLIALVRQLPPLARFLPMQGQGQGQAPGGVSHLYRIRLRSTGSAPCANLPFTCNNGVLVDAQP